MKRVTRWFERALHPSARWAAAVAVAMGVSVVAAAAPPVGPLGATLTGQNDGFGTIKGRLVWGGDATPQPKVLVPAGQAKNDPAVCAKDGAILSQDLVVDPKTKGIRGAFAYLVQPKGANPEAVNSLVAAKPIVQIDQVTCEFVPHATAMHQGQKLLLKSSDPVNHNVRYAAFNKVPFNQILPAKGEVQLKMVSERRPIPLACDIHPWMSAYLMVFNHPFYAVTGPDGSFEIKGVPPGMQNLIVWQSTKGFVTEGLSRGKPVQVKAGEVTDVGDVVLKP